LRGLLGRLCGPERYEAVQFLERAVIIALAAVDDALEALKGRGAFGESGAGAGCLEFGAVLEARLGGVVPEVGFDVAQTAQTPFVVDERVDEETLSGIDGTVLIVEFGGEFGEVLGGFVEHDLGFGVDAVLEGVVAGVGLPPRGDGALRFLAVGPAGSLLFRGSHT